MCRNFKIKYQNILFEQRERKVSRERDLKRDPSNGMFALRKGKDDLNEARRIIREETLIFNTTRFDSPFSLLISCLPIRQRHVSLYCINNQHVVRLIDLRPPFYPPFGHQQTGEGIPSAKIHVAAGRSVVKGVYTLEG